jgi:outer membrane protein assembly factor BamB
MITAERLETRNRSLYDCYHLSDTIPNPSSGYAEGRTYNSQGTREISKTSIGGLMNSSWSMFCHDVKHTGQSPYGASGNCLIEKWKTRLTGFVTFSTPIIANDGTMYIGTCGWQSKFHAVNPNGTEKWEFDVGDWVVSSPAIGADGTVYVATDSVSSNAHLFAINSDGSEKWVIPFGSGIYSSPVIAQDGTIFIGAHEKMCAINPNGTILWSYTTGNAIKASPTIGSDGTVYVASHDGYFYAFYPSNGTIKWKLNIAEGISCYSSPAIDSNGTIYYGTRNTFYAINPNGTVKWTTGGGCYYGGPVISSDGTIYACGNDRLYAFNQNGSAKWAIWLGADMASPAITKDGMIYAVMGWGYDHGSDTVCLVSPNGNIISSLRLVPDISYDTADLESSLSIGVDGTVYLGSWFIRGGNPGSVGYLHAIGTIQNEPPNTPTITGPTKGDVGKNYPFHMRTTDPEGNNISYYVDWGDGTNSGWIGSYPSGQEQTVSHTWSKKGPYTIQVMSKDNYSSESGWGTLSVTMPSSYDIPFMNLLEKILERFPNAFPILRQLVGY